ncbi:MAG: UDP-N-acetylmuramate--L-alanine ligase [Bacteroidetes bacterium]|nr:UDP-N-acetylmuramate--L-alanine ligase [Bacteroidota bacterium]
MLLPYERLHFVGIGGVGMVALAEVLLAAGHRVTGSDLAVTPATERLRTLGVTVCHGHAAGNVEGADLLIVSSAIPEHNPEVQRARELGLPIWKRADLLGAITRQRKSILVSGTHGKTTTSAMISLVLEGGGLSPTFLVGGDLRNLGTGARLGSGPYLVAEADEFDRSFLRMSPWAAVVTNVEADHLDYYGTLEAVVEAFRQFVALVPQEGMAILCADSPRALALAAQCQGKVVTYGFSPAANWRAAEVSPNSRGGNDCLVRYNGRPWGRVSLQVPGRHNVSNALAAVAAAAGVGVPAPAIQAALSDFKGTGRRYERRGSYRGAELYDDYAHHPTEVRATLAAAREQHPGRLWAVFQPHTTHRLKSLFDGFVMAFGDADRVVVVDTYLPPGREREPGDLTSADLVRAMDHPNARHIGPLGEAADYLAGELQEGDVVLVMGAGDVTVVTEALLSKEAAREIDHGR